MDIRKEFEDIDLARLVTLIRNLEALTESNVVRRNPKLSDAVQLLYNRAVEELARRARTFE
jgi:hypothetical protein